MATDCIPQVTFDFQGVRQPIVARFDQAHASSEGGALLLKAIDERLELTQRLAACLTDRRQPGKVEHELIELVRQRVFGIACGYADGNDAARLRQDPIHKLLLERDPLAGAALGSQPTLSRFENAVGLREVVAMGQVLAASVIGQHQRRLQGRAECITIDLDPTVDPTHGQQQLTFFNGHYDTACYLPLVATLTFNDERLDKRVRRLLGRARMASKASGQSERRYGETRYAAKKWSHKRRVIMKAEVVRYPGRAPRDNPRFVVTNLPDPPQTVYEIYGGRGDMENRIKELKEGLGLDRTSCPRFRANQFRVLLTVAAYLLYQTLQQHARGTACAGAQVSTLRERLIKLAVWVERSVRRIVLHLPATFPWLTTWRPSRARRRRRARLSPGAGASRQAPHRGGRKSPSCDGPGLLPPPRSRPAALSGRHSRPVQACRAEIVAPDRAWAVRESQNADS
jgi:Transposase DDE domain group 1